MEISKEERTWTLAAHLAGPIGILASAGLLGFVVPLVIWLVKREESAFIEDQAKEALNFQITIFLLMVTLIVLAVLTLGLGLLIAIPAFLVLAILQVVLGIIAGMRAYEGTLYRYPFALRIIT